MNVMVLRINVMLLRFNIMVLRSNVMVLRIHWGARCLNVSNRDAAIM